MRRALTLALLASLAAGGTTAQAFDATISRTSYGIPHIKARTWGSLGWGYGFALAQDNLCTVAETYVTVRAERSRYFGQDKGYVSRGNGSTINNLNSDFFYKRIIDRGTIEKLLTQPPPLGPRNEVKAAVRGYVAGYNEYLRRTPVDRLPDPRCRGRDWVKPIAEIDAYRRFYSLALLASQGVAIDGIAASQPPGGAASSTPVPSLPEQMDMLRELGERLPVGAIGSNAVALGKAATSNGRGMLLGNPHFPWDGPERFHQAHLRIPGKLNAAGAMLHGVPVVLIGHTPTVAWSHTVSTGFRFTPFELRLVPGQPTKYMYDGEARDMKAEKVTVDLGGGKTASRTLYSTHHGSILTSILGLPLFPWTPTGAYAMGDANESNFRYLNHFFEINQARTANDVFDILRRNQGIPWVNTIAADADGRAFYADISVVPNVPDSHRDACVAGPLGLAAPALLGLPVLDGSTASCEWLDDPDALQKGIFGPSHLPHLFRDDYVTNSNDSYWLSNPRQPLEGFARIIGAERTARALRTRSGLVMVEEKLRDGGRFQSLKELQDLLLSNRQYMAELSRSALVDMCKANPTLPGSNGPVDVSGACPILERWDGRDDLDSHGAVLFRRFASRVLAAPATGVPAQGVWQTPFSAEDPVNTPRDLDTDSPVVRRALADAVADLNGAGIPLDGTLRDWQTEPRGGESVPVHGGPGTVGVFNAINSTWRGKDGYRNIEHGSSFIMTVRFDGDSCPQSEAILTYSLSENPESPHFADQTKLFSQKRWVPMRTCEKEIKRDKKLKVKRLRSPKRR